MWIWRAFFCKRAHVWYLGINCYKTFSKNICINSARYLAHHSCSVCHMVHLALCDSDWLLAARREITRWRVPTGPSSVCHQRRLFVRSPLCCPEQAELQYTFIYIYNIYIFFILISVQTFFLWGSSVWFLWPLGWPVCSHWSLCLHTQQMPALDVYFITGWISRGDGDLSQWFYLN